MSSFGSARDASRANLLLARLPEAEIGRLLERLEHVRLPLRTVVADPGEASRYAYFPLSSVFSSIIPLTDGSAIEVATIGNEGMVGIDLLSDLPTSVYRVVQQVEGENLRLPAEVFRRTLAEAGPLARLMQRYSLTITHQASQSAACNARHSVEERMCRWLLMTHDRVGCNEFYLTQEFLSIMLGVRRQSVSVTAAVLQRAGLLRYSRGNMSILDRMGLEAAACECYSMIRTTYEQVMGQST